MHPKGLSLTLLATAFLSLPCLGHDLWIEGQVQSRVLQYGHAVGSHQGEASLTYPPERVTESLCLDREGKTVAASTSQTYPVTLNADCSLTWFQTSSGYWSKTPYGTRNVPKDQAGQTFDSWLSMEGIKRLDLWHPEFSRPVGRHLELTPLENPFRKGKGDKLALRAWHQGRPAAGVTVAYFGKPRGTTDPDGNINVRLQQQGMQLIQASLTLPLQDPRADKVIHASSLQFQMP